MSEDIATIGVRVDTRDLPRGERALDSLAARGERTERRVSRSSALMTSGMRSVAAIAGTMAGALAGGMGIAAVAREVGTFETAMSGVAAVTRATTQDLALMRETALLLGRTTEFSAAQAADGLRFLGMAGFSAQEAVAALPDTLDLATGAGMGLAQAADIASNVLSGFGMRAGEAGRVADVLAAASSRANTDVGQLGSAMSTVAPISAALGISLEDTAGAIGVLSDAGIQGERAGTALRGILASLASPTDGARDALAAYGITLDQVNPATRDLSEIMTTLNAAGISASDAMEIFGREAASGALALQSASGRLGDLSTELLNVQGAASDMASVMRDNLQGDIAGFQSAVSGLLITIGDAGLTGAMRASVQAMTAATQFMAENFTPALELAGLTAAAIAATQLPAFVGGLYASVTAMAASTTAAGILTGAMRALGVAVSLAGGPWGVLAGIIVAAAGYFILFRDNAAEVPATLDQVREAQGLLNTSLGVFQTGAAGSGAEAIAYARNLQETARSALVAAEAVIAFNESRLNGVSPEALAAMRAQPGWESNPMRGVLEQSAQAREQVAASRIAMENAGRTLQALQIQAHSAGDALRSVFEVPDETTIVLPEIVLPEFPEAPGGGSVVDAYQDVTDAARDAQDASERWASGMAGHFDGIITGGRDASSVLMSMARQLESSAWQTLFSGISGSFGGGGNGGGFFRNLFAGFFDTGGMIPAGQFGIAGERGPEIITGPARVTSRADTARMMHGSGKPVQVVVRLEPSGEFDARVAETAGAMVRVEGPNMVRSEVSGGGIDNQMGARFGTAPARIRR